MKNKKNLNTLLNKNISLTKDHHYILNEEDSKTVCHQSVTDIIGSHFHPFDKELIARSLVKHVPKYSGMKWTDLISEWDKKRDYGSKVHGQLEKYILSKKQPTLKLAKIGAEWFNTNHKKYGNKIYPEVKVFSKEHELGGTVDLLIYNKEKDGCYIFDWKTSGSDIHKSKGKGITSVTSDLKDCKYTTYELQLSMYKYLLQEIHDIKIINQFMVHLKDSTVDVLKTKYYKTHCIKMLKDLPAEDEYDEDYDDEDYDDFEKYRQSDEYKAEISSAVRKIQKGEYSYDHYKASKDTEKFEGIFDWVVKGFLFIAFLSMLNAFCFGFGQ